MSSMSKLTIKPSKPYAAKSKLCELADSDDSDNTDMAYVSPPHLSDDEDEMPTPTKKKKSRKHKKRKIWNTDTCFVDTIFYVYIMV